MISVAVIGAAGYVGKALSESFVRKPEIQLIKVTRDNYEAMSTGSYDILINAAMPSKRFWAKNNPELDFEATVLRTANLLYGWKYQKFIQISSVSARCEKDTVYGRHKAAAEALCDPARDLIVRLSALYSPELAKGALMDILKSEPVFVSGESRYAFTPLNFVGEWMSQNLNRTGLVEVGARDTLSLSEVADHLGRKILFSGTIENQSIMNPEPGYPEARRVLNFMDEMKRKVLI